MRSFEFEPKRILVPVDFGELSSLALKYAAVGASVFGSEILVLHAQRFEVPPYVLADEYEKVLNRLKESKQMVERFLTNYIGEVLGSAAKRLKIKTLLFEAHPVDAILQTAETEQADLIVMGTHGRKGLERLYLGSVTERVVRESKIPVFIVKQKERDFIDVNDPNSKPNLKRILCPVNFKPVSENALLHAASIATRFEAELTVLYIDEEKESNLDELKEKLCQWLPAGLSDRCSLKPLVKSGHPPFQIVSAAEEGNYDLLVLGAERRRLLSAVLFGTTTEAILRSSPIPTLVVPAKETQQKSR